MLSTQYGSHVVQFIEAFTYFIFLYLSETSIYFKEVEIIVLNYFEERVRPKFEPHNHPSKFWRCPVTRGEVKEN
ncbi:unnamed protein product [Allacma fusca]|uniref:Uncharacterized protein n=1 Tax=Allacma fusca TaxID=39272 RepID=A0A8J2NWQ1_9HEXA|nr:unnamed protein product [Allacma fusca]